MPEKALKGGFMDCKSEIHIEEKIKTPPRLSLDSLSPGERLDTDIRKWRKSKTLPTGVTSRGLYRDIGIIAWPAMLELFLNHAASMADQMMVGRLGTWAISAVGLSTQPRFLLISTVMSINVGATAMVARFKGAGDRERANNILRQAILLNLFIAIFVSTLFYIFAGPIIKFMGAEDGLVLLEATKYLKIQAAGFITVSLTSTVTAVLRGVGNSRAALIYNMMSNVVNVFSNWVLIYGNLGAPSLGVVGASLATVIGQASAMIMSLIVISRKNAYLCLSLKGLKPDREALCQITSIGIPVMIERVVMRVGMVAYSKMIASLGTVMLATHQICSNVMQFSFVIIEGCQVSVTSLIGQSIGKKRSDMAQAYSIRCRRAGMSLAVVTGLIFFFGARLLISLYLDANDPDRDIVLENGVRILRLLALYQPFQASQFILGGVLRGAGDTKATAIIYLITVMIVRPATAALFIYVFEWGLLGGWLSMGFDQFLRYLLVLLRFNSGKWIYAVKMRE